MYERLNVWLSALLAENEVFAGLIAATAVGMLLYLTRSIPSAVWRLAIRHLTVELTVRNTDPAFDWVRLWLSRHPYGRRARRLRLSACNRYGDGGWEWTLVPGEGFHLFLHRGRPIALRYTVNDDQSRGGRLNETLHLRAPARNPAFLRALVAEAVRIGSSIDRVAIYGWFDFWQLAAWKRQRPLETVILPDGLMDLVVEDCAWFFGAEDWYLKRGVPYRRGYLFAGPPGTGKSSLALALAGHFGRPLFTLDLSAIGDESMLAEAFADVPRGAVLLLEDVDACRAARPRPTTDTGCEGRAERLTATGLLNAVDGVTAADGRLLIMTTNHPQRLDPALIRPGRIDLRLPFRLLGRREARRMYLRFHPGEEAQADAFAAAVPLPLSAAELQRRLMAADHMAGPCRADTAVAVE